MSSLSVARATVYFFKEFVKNKLVLPELYIVICCFYNLQEIQLSNLRCSGLDSCNLIHELGVCRNQSVERKLLV